MVRGSGGELMANVEAMLCVEAVEVFKQIWSALHDQVYRRSVSSGPSLE